MSTRTAVLVLTAATLVGVILTLIAGQEPGILLGFFVIVGTIAAGLGIQRGRVYLLFPAPVLAFFVAAIVTGKVHDAKLGSSTAGLGAGLLQWVAGIFFPAAAATLVILLIGAGRWLLDRQVVTGKSVLAAGRPVPGNARPFPQSGRSDAERGADGDPFDGPAPRFSGTGPTPRQGTGPTPRQGTGPTPRQGTGPTPRQGTGPTPRQGTGPTPRQGTGPVPPDNGSWQGAPNGTRPGRPGRPGRFGRDDRADLDPWGDPRLPADRSQPPHGTGPRSHVPGRPSSQSQPRAPRPQPEQPWSPDRRPQRRPQPPDGYPTR